MHLLTKGSLSKIRNDAAGVKELKAQGFALAGECDEEGNLTPTSVVLEDDEDDPKTEKPLSPEKKALVDAALAAGVIDPKTEKPATEKALGRWGDKKLTEATEAALKDKA
jgi:hypothetical protein